LVFLVPLFIAVAARHALRENRRTRLATAAVSLAIPAILLAPWIVFNLDHYGSLTGVAVAREMQSPVVDPEGEGYTLARLGKELPALPESATIAAEWGLEVAFVPALSVALEIFRVAILWLPLLLVVADPRGLRGTDLAFLVVPVGLGVTLLAFGSLASDWRLVQARYLYPVLPGLAIFAALMWRRLPRPNRTPTLVSTICAIALIGAWARLAAHFLIR
jgi:hypothetical protein